MIFSKLKVTKLLINKYRMHNLYAIFAKLLNICKQVAGNLVNESEVCRFSRSKRCGMGKKDFEKAPGVGYCASQITRSVLLRI